AAERGGNCELTAADETRVVDGVTIMGPTNLPATVPFHASSMYAKNLVTFLSHLVKEGAFQWDMEDQITVETLLARDGEIVLPRLRESLGLGAPTAADAQTPGPAQPEGTAELRVAPSEGVSNGAAPSNENATTT
ncbi:MAG TPA: NAD(P)(+) transhydrogenase (Re/Si-specific) subunit alpha, partial [Actinomycetota bacterium]|nr:NAD(P)(+) transhydrogenase (Re/Si-specific) subunit alpha [Actinomycetota bacterium]